MRGSLERVPGAAGPARRRVDHHDLDVHEHVNIDQHVDEYLDVDQHVDDDQHDVNEHHVDQHHDDDTAVASDQLVAIVRFGV
jgi:hypothetical protein